MKLVKDTVKNQENEKNVSDKEAEEAFTTLLGVSFKPSLSGSSPIHLNMVLKASSASLSETFFSFS